jgi:hypothetical protein
VEAQQQQWQAEELRRQEAEQQQNLRQQEVKRIKQQEAEQLNQQELQRQRAKALKQQQTGSPPAMPLISQPAPAFAGRLPAVPREVSLQSFEFEVVLVNNQGKIAHRRTAKADYFVEILKRKGFFGREITS